MSRRQFWILCLWFLAAPLAARQPALAPFGPGGVSCQLSDWAFSPLSVSVPALGADLSKSASAFPPKHGASHCHPKPVGGTLLNAQPPGRGHTPRVRRSPRTLKMAAGFRASGPVPVKAMGDNFEQVYGNDHYSEQALKGAVPVQVCSPGGYVSVGFTRSSDKYTDSDVYVVRVKDDGTASWERTFDLGDHSGDVGTSVRELHHSAGNGFIVTGTTGYEDNNRDIFLLRLDCNGDPVWLQVLKTKAEMDGPATDDVANDVMETDTGALVPLGQPRQGDLVVAGFSRRQDGGGAFDTDAYLVRTDPLGSVIWSQTYANWGKNVTNPYAREWFNALNEAQPTGSQPVGDVLAAGAQADADLEGWKDGLAVRVSGVNGRFTAPLHVMANFNVPDVAGSQERLTELWAIRELHQGGESLNIVLVGNIADAGSPTEGYAAKTGPKLNNLLAERVIGDGFSGSGDEGFADVQEIVPPTLYGSAGDLVVAGYATIHGSQDMAMLALSAASLTPVYYTGRLFGDHSGAEERATALSQAPPASEYALPGFYVNGFTRSDPVGVTDPEDMFLVRTNPGGATGCSILWEPYDLEPEPEVCYPEEHVEDPAALSLEWPIFKETPSWGSEICQ